jgi:phosphate starvation-inducible PhoH-like protein
MGMNAKMIVTGDVTQIDLPSYQQSGLVHSLIVLNHVKGVGKVEFNKKDIVRHKLVQRIVEAYEKSESKDKETKETKKIEKVNNSNQTTI